MSDRREKSRRIAWIVSERIREVTIPGLGQWDLAWELVACPSDHFMDALYQWELSGLAEDLESVQQAAEALVVEWRDANGKLEAVLQEDSPETEVQDSGASPIPTT